jgi:hypothetical protein
MLLKFFLYKQLGVGAYLLEQHVGQQLHRLSMRKIIFRLLCDLVQSFLSSRTYEVRVCLFVCERWEQLSAYLYSVVGRQHFSNRESVKSDSSTCLQDRQ